jgi:hypothetical protein
MLTSKTNKHPNYIDCAINTLEIIQESSNQGQEEPLLDAAL